MSVDAKTMTVVLAIKQAIETSQNPGLSVNSHPNPLFIKVLGDLDLQKIAGSVLKRLEDYEASVKARFEASVKARFEASVKKLVAGIEAELQAGATDIEKALEAFRIKVADKWAHTEEEAQAAVKWVREKI